MILTVPVHKDLDIIPLIAIISDCRDINYRYFFDLDPGQFHFGAQKIYQAYKYEMGTEKTYGSHM